MQGIAPVTAVALIVGAFLLGAYASGSLSPLRRRRPWTSRPPFQREHTQPDLTDVGQQFHAVMAASFQKRKLLSLREYRAFKTIEEVVMTERRGHRVFAQANLGEILKTPDANAYRSINSKRVDILVVDRGGWPVLAVEYQGNGHYQGVAAARDAIKKEALRKAGVGYVEVSATDTDAQVRTRVREALGWHDAPASDGQDSGSAPRAAAMH